ncbi:hypothetical protein ES708_32700 [subsurface metagenome]
MKKTSKRIPISDAKAIGEKHGYSQVIVVAWNEEENNENEIFRYISTSRANYVSFHVYIHCF